MGEWPRCPPCKLRCTHARGDLFLRRNQTYDCECGCNRPYKAHCVQNMNTLSLWAIHVRVYPFPDSRLDEVMERDPSANAA
eukprot:2690888-Pleurochrysis_carterae.AAC.4